MEMQTFQYIPDSGWLVAYYADLDSENTLIASEFPNYRKTSTELVKRCHHLLLKHENQIKP